MIQMHTKCLLSNRPDTFELISNEDMLGNIAYAFKQQYHIDTDDQGRVIHFAGSACEFWFSYK